MDLTKSKHITNMKKYLHEIDTIEYNKFPDKKIITIIDMYKYLYYYCSEFLHQMRYPFFS